MVRSLLLSAFLVSVAAVAGCSRDSKGAGVTYYESYDPRSLDPAFSTDVPPGEMVTLLYDCLTQFTPNGELQPGLADRWSAEAGGKRYVFHLRASARFHDGSAVTPAHV